MTEEQRKHMKQDARKKRKTFIGGPTDPEQAKPSAGVGAIAEEGLCIYTLTDPIDD